VAIFQISNYSTTMVRVNKPFNPILGETFECERYGVRTVAHTVAEVPWSQPWTTARPCGRTGGGRGRPERGSGWRYLAEQVSHHPPVSACHANALDNRWEWWQTVQVSPFFRGKDLDVQPKGITHVKLNQFKEHITFRKVRQESRRTSKRWMRFTCNCCPRTMIRHVPGHYLRAQHHCRQAVG